MRTSTSSSVIFSPNPTSRGLSSTAEILPFPSLSKCLRPSTKSSTVSVICLLDTACNIGRNCSKVTLPSVLPQGSENISHLLHRNATVALRVEEEEALLEVRQLVLGESGLLRHLDKLGLPHV